MRRPTMGQPHRIAMTLFKPPRLKRRFASAALVLWVLVLGVAWSNACLLRDRTTHLDPAFLAIEGLPAVTPGHIGVSASDAQNQSPGSAPCLKVCDDASQTIVKWQWGTELPGMALLPSFAMEWSVSGAALDASQPVRIERPTRAGLALRTRYVRLTL